MDWSALVIMCWMLKFKVLSYKKFEGSVADGSEGHIEVNWTDARLLIVHSLCR